MTEGEQQVQEQIEELIGNDLLPGENPGKVQVGTQLKDAVQALDARTGSLEEQLSHIKDELIVIPGMKDDLSSILKELGSFNNRMDSMGDLLLRTEVRKSLPIGTKDAQLRDGGKRLENAKKIVDLRKEGVALALLEEQRVVVPIHELQSFTSELRSRNVQISGYTFLEPDSVSSARVEEDTSSS